MNRQRRIFFQYDPASDIQPKGGFGSDMEALMGYVFDFADMPGGSGAAGPNEEVILC